MEKPTFVKVLTGIIEAFENPYFQDAMAEAEAAGDADRLIQLPMDVQEKVFTTNGIDLVQGVAEFKAAGRQFGADADVTPLLTRMRQALGK